MNVFCPVLLSGKYLPTKCAHRRVSGGQNIAPPVEWAEVPSGVKSFALSIIDRHPVANNWVHWFVVNIPAAVREIHEGASGIRDLLPPGSLEIRNSYGDIGYGGPNPPRGSGAHVYEITVYALSIGSTGLGPFATLDECLAGIRPHVVASANTAGTFEQ